MIVFEQFFVLTHENVQIPDILFLLPNSRWKSRLTIYIYIYIFISYTPKLRNFHYLKIYQYQRRAIIKRIVIDKNKYELFADFTKPKK